MKRSGKHMKRKMRRGHWILLRILEIVMIIFAIILFTDVLAGSNEQIFQVSSNSVFFSQFSDKQLSELKDVEINQNIPIPEDVAKKMLEERLEKEKQEKIAKEKEEKAKKEAEEKKKKEAEAKKLASAKQVTTRSSTTTRATGSKAEYQSYARQKCKSYGWSDYDYQCLVNIVNRESGWRVNASNSSSGAYGLFQALPASKMASAGSDYLTNYKTQINWGCSYIKNRYGSPSKAWSFWQIHHWY